MECFCAGELEGGLRYAWLRVYEVGFLEMVRRELGMWILLCGKYLDGFVWVG